MQVRFDNLYARLPDRFFARVDPTPVQDPNLLHLNHVLAEHLGLDAEELSTPEGIAVLAGNRVPDGAEPLAMAYGGHQFGHWVPRLGDGRAILLGEVLDRDGMRRDLQLKGSGPTPFSRGGDGRAGIGPVLREYIVSEAMAALGVPTTRSLAAVSTGQPIYRERPRPGAILTRVAQSHIRVGTFQFFAHQGDHEALRILADHVIARHHYELAQPEAAGEQARYLMLLDAVIGRQAKLIAHWQLVGFIHGVMNTDNTSIAGETIDYGPCAFMDTYHPDTVYSSIDRQGRYAYHNQPSIALWNLSGFAKTLLPLMGDDQEAAIAQALERLETFGDRFGEEYLTGMRRKLGLTKARDGDDSLAEDLLTRMADQRADFTSTFRLLSEVSTTTSEQDEPVRQLFDEPEAFDQWVAPWRQRLSEETSSEEERQTLMRSVNPAVIPRNHLVEEALQAAETRDLAPFKALMDVLAQPYESQPACSPYTAGPRPDQVVHQTFCGT
jgi:uncharacterized protein YdiU (UPF0061 family)